MKLRTEQQWLAIDLEASRRSRKEAARILRVSPERHGRILVQAHARQEVQARPAVVGVLRSADV